MSPEYSILFLRQGALWKFPARRGTTIPSSVRPERLLGIHYKPHRWLRLAATPGDRYATIDFDGEESTVLVDLQHGSTRQLRGAHYPSFSPDGNHLAAPIERTDSTEEVQVLDLRTNQWRVLLRGASQPFWSAKGTEIAAIVESPDKGRCGVVVDARTGAIRFRSRSSVLWSLPLLSPSGQYFAMMQSLSRPQLGHLIIDRRTGKILERNLDGMNRLSSLIEDWSPNGTFLLCNWRIPDPENDGSWLGDEVGLVSLAPGVKRRLGRGYSPRFTPDGQYILYLRPYRQGISERPGDLCISPVSGGPPRVLANDVDAFAISERP